MFYSKLTFLHVLLFFLSCKIVEFLKMAPEECIPLIKTFWRKENNTLFPKKLLICNQMINNFINNPNSNVKFIIEKKENNIITILSITMNGVENNLEFSI